MNGVWPPSAASLYGAHRRNSKARGAAQMEREEPVRMEAPAF